MLRNVKKRIEKKKIVDNQKNSKWLPYFAFFSAGQFKMALKTGFTGLKATN
jgi:hypothetical protein